MGGSNYSPLGILIPSRSKNGISGKVLDDIQDLNHVHFLLSHFMPFLSLIFIYKRFSFCYLFKCSKFSGAQNSCAQNFGAQISCTSIMTLGILASFLKEPQYLKRISS